MLGGKPEVQNMGKNFPSKEQSLRGRLLTVCYKGFYDSYSARKSARAGLAVQCELLNVPTEEHVHMCDQVSGCHWDN